MNDFDSVDIILIILGFCLGVSLIICVNNASKISDEKSCVEFYKKNSYVLDSCQKYKEKLEG